MLTEYAVVWQDRINLERVVASSDMERKKFILCKQRRNPLFQNLLLLLILRMFDVDLL